MHQNDIDGVELHAGTLAAVQITEGTRCCRSVEGCTRMSSAMSKAIPERHGGVEGHARTSSLVLMTEGTWCCPSVEGYTTMSSAVE
jgi:hypothetical protein